MSDEHDSWFKDAFGVDLGSALKTIQDEASTAVGQVAGTVGQIVQGAQGVVEGAIDEVTGAATAIVKKVAGVAGVGPAGPAGAGAAPSGGGTGTFPLGGSVGRGGQNVAKDVSAVQTALGINADGQCGAQTIGAIEAFQRTLGQAKPDGRVDAGGATERALAGGAKPAAAADAPPAAPDGGAPAADAADDSGGLLGQLQSAAAGLFDDAKNLGGKLAGGPDSGGEMDTEERDAALRAELTAQIEGAPARTGLIGELNDLDDFRKTDPDPVPENTTSFAGVSPLALDGQIKDKEFAIAQMEATRTNMCRKARADARLLTENLKRDLTAALLATALVVAVPAITAKPGATIAVLIAEIGAIVTGHELFKKYRDNLRLLVDKTKADLTILNTTIATERKKLDAMKQAAAAAPIRPDDLPDAPKRPEDLPDAREPPFTRPEDLPDARK